MSSRFVDVPAAAIRERLAAAGFHLLPAASGEEVYERPHDKDSRYIVKVYSSIQRGSTGVRECGEDAIRTVALLVNACHALERLIAWLDLYGPIHRRLWPILRAAKMLRDGIYTAESIGVWLEHELALEECVEEAQWAAVPDH